MNTILELIITALSIIVPALTSWLLWYIKQSKKHQKAKWEMEKEYLIAIKENKALSQKCEDIVAIIQSIEETVPDAILPILKRITQKK
ncbi:MAG: hypothetical protein LBV53_03010 [Mycoplasmataceae bacterium]|nr:hypothetical protein [Mycoplasmataceae bacterium]